MENINDILARAAALRDETALNSIDPARAGGIMYDTLIALNDLWLQQGAALVISKIYASVAAMEADTAPVSDLTGQPIHAGQIVVIASSDADNGSVYRFNGVTGGVSSWSLVGNIGSQCVGVTENTNTGGDDLHVGGSVIKAINAGYQFMGVATTATNPGTPDQKIFYIASTPGTYTNFGNLSVNDGEVAMLVWNASWTKLSIELSQAIRIAIAPNEVDVNPEDPTSFETQFGATAESVLKHGLVYYGGDEYPVYFVALGCVGDSSGSYGTITFVGGLQGVSVYTIALEKIAGEVCPTSFKTFELTPDAVPTEASENPVSSGGVYAALNKCKYVSIAKNPMLLTVNNPSNPTVLIESELGCTIDDLLSVGQARSGADNNPVYYTISGGLFKQLNAYSGTISFITDKSVFILSLMTGYLVGRTVFELRATDATLAANSINPIQNRAVYNALASKQDTLTFDDAPTAGSNNPVKSSGIKDAISTAISNLTLLSDADSIGSALNLSISDAAEALGVSANALRSLLNGKYFYFKYGTWDTYRLPVTEIKLHHGGESGITTVTLGNNNIVIHHNDMDDTIDITVNQ